MIGEASLPDVNSGYFIHSPATAAEHFRDSGPAPIDGGPIARGDNRALCVVEHAPFDAAADRVTASTSAGHEGSHAVGEVFLAHRTETGTDQLQPDARKETNVSRLRRGNTDLCRTLTRYE